MQTALDYCFHLSSLEILFQRCHSFKCCIIPVTLVFVSYALPIFDKNYIQHWFVSRYHLDFQRPAPVGDLYPLN